MSKLGIKKGDIFIKVNGEDITEKTVADVANMIKNSGKSKDKTL